MTFDEEGMTPKVQPLCLPIATAGIKTGKQFAGFMSALMTDIIQGSVDVKTANALCNAGGKLLNVVEMEHKFGRNPTKAEDRTLSLA